jgi:hypothetical protein
MSPHKKKESFTESCMEMLCVVGLDLAAKESRPSGWALLRGKSIEVKTLFSNKEILVETLREEPRIIAIDAPLSLPRKGINRFVDREMHKRGYPVLPPLYPAMKLLTERGMLLAKAFRESGIEVIEVHPASSMKALSVPRHDSEVLSEVFAHLGLGLEATLTCHEIDAVFAALTAYLYLRGQCEIIGDEEGTIIVPIRQIWRQLKIE